jgi:hypothetical protein
MTIQLDNIKYNLHDEETNPDNEITAIDFELPSKLEIKQEVIDNLYGEDFSFDRDIKELISCHTGFEPESFTHTIQD